jgi:hypothetical protein
MGLYQPEDQGWGSSRQKRRLEHAESVEIARARRDADRSAR